MIGLNKVSKSYGATQAVSEVSINIEAQEKLILLGTSGCGKTTLLKMINRLIEPDSGEITVSGQDIRQQPVEVLRKGIGYVLQHNGLFPHYTVEENIAIVPKLLKWDKNKTSNRVRQLVEKLHLPQNSLGLYPHELSGGQQQRVGLARALASDPPILLMDEPFGALDNVTRMHIQQEFKHLEEFKRKTVVMVTHDVQEAFDLGDRICLMDRGRVVQIGTPRELLYRPVNDFARSFFDNQRLQLAFRVVKIKDIWDAFEQVDHPSGTCLSADHNVWETMEAFQKEHVTELYFQDGKKKCKRINADQLSLAFNQYQKNKADE